jgi:hypothetical protein
MSLAKVLLPVLVIMFSVASTSAQPVIAFHTITNDIDIESYGHHLRLSELTFDEDPWLTDSDIVTWDVSSGWVFLAGDKWTFLEEFDPSFRGKGYLSCHFKLFVVLVKGEPCFIGEFHSVVSSLGARYPCFSEMGLRFTHKNALVMHSRTWDPKFVEALKGLGLYRGGLEVIITDVRINNNEALSKSSIEFDIELTNRDHGDLMVLDPDLMVPGFNGFRPWLFVELVGSNKNQFSEQIRMPGGRNEFNKDWMIRVPSNGTLSNTLIREIERLDSGTYNCHLIYPGTRDVGNGDLGFGNARIWFGQVHSNEVEVRLE